MSGKKVRVRMKANARPRNGKQLLDGEEYTLPETMADRLATIGKAEIIDTKAPAKPRRKPRQATQPKRAGRGFDECLLPN